MKIAAREKNLKFLGSMGSDPTAYVVKRIKNIPIAFIGAVLKDTASIVTASGIAGLNFTDEAEAINKQVRKLIYQ
jgi:2',3'-cyclic-nucleotide 2'-phosphodiesterase (5'-nucleotidase family)